MPRNRSIDIDDHLDLKIVKHLLKDTIKIISILKVRSNKKILKI